MKAVKAELYMHVTGLGYYYLSVDAEPLGPGFSELRRQFGVRFTDDDYPVNDTAAATLAWAKSRGLSVIDATREKKVEGAKS